MNVNDMWKVPITDDAQPAMRAEAERAMRRARRDRFAGLAMQQLIADEALVNRESVVRVAVIYADLMIAELDRTEPK